eukprot:5219755-Amphidinium_carterae.1
MAIPCSQQAKVNMTRQEMQFASEQCLSQHPVLVVQDHKRVMGFPGPTDAVTCDGVSALEAKHYDKTAEHCLASHIALPQAALSLP